MQPDNEIFKSHHIDITPAEITEAEASRERFGELIEVLEHPEWTEYVYLSYKADKTNLLYLLDQALITVGTGGLTLRHFSTNQKEYPARVSFFQPYETVKSDKHPGVRFSSAFLAIETFKRAEDGSLVNTPVGRRILLLTLGHTERRLNNGDLRLGEDVVFGVHVDEDDGEIKPFRLVMGDNTREQPRLERPDKTEESGAIVESRGVQNSGKTLAIEYVDRKTEPQVYQELIREIDKFVISERWTKKGSWY